MVDLTPSSTGYSLYGNTDAEVRVGADGVRIRARGKRNAPWRFLPWSEVWMNATQEVA